MLIFREISSVGLHRYAGIAALFALSACADMNHPLDVKAASSANASLAASKPAPQVALPMPHAEAPVLAMQQPPVVERWQAPISEASSRFGIPQAWIKAVITVESHGQAWNRDGRPLTSARGAVGLMQVKPETYSVLRTRYALGQTPADPRDNILAGTAYLREMYDRFGYPNMLAAYNAGPQRTDAWLSGFRELPDETMQYLSVVSNWVRDVFDGRDAKTVVMAQPAKPVAVTASPDVVQNTIVGSTSSSPAPSQVPASEVAANAVNPPDSSLAHTRVVTFPGRARSQFAMHHPYAFACATWRSRLGLCRFAPGLHRAVFASAF